MTEMYIENYQRSVPTDTTLSHSTVMESVYIVHDMGDIAEVVKCRHEAHERIRDGTPGGTQEIWSVIDQEPKYCTDVPATNS